MSDDGGNYRDPAGDALSASELRRLRFRNIPLRVVLPNLVTLLALCMGLTSIRYAIDGKFETAVTAVMAAAVLDGLDGRLARAIKGTSRCGAELDSLADFIDFGVAPAMLLYFWTLNEFKSAGWFAVMVYVVACALRLARFNVMIDDPKKPSWMGQFFVGMPSPAVPSPPGVRGTATGLCRRASRPPPATTGTAARPACTRRRCRTRRRTSPKPGPRPGTPAAARWSASPMWSSNRSFMTVPP